MRGKLVANPIGVLRQASRNCASVYKWHRTLSLDLFSSSPYSMPAMDKVYLEMLPETSQIDGAKRWDDEKGEFAQICYQEEARHIAFFRIKPGFWRGKHYHEKKDEVFYVVSGRMRAVFVDIDSGRREELELVRGHRL